MSALNTDTPQFPLTANAQELAIPDDAEPRGVIPEGMEDLQRRVAELEQGRAQDKERLQKLEIVNLELLEIAVAAQLKSLRDMQTMSERHNAARTAIAQAGERSIFNRGRREWPENWKPS